MRRNHCLACPHPSHHGHASITRTLAQPLAASRQPWSAQSCRGPAQPSPTLGDALNAGYLYLEVRCLGCDTHQTVALDIVRRPKTTPIHELERYNAMPGLLAGSRLSLQAQSSGRAANDEDFSERSAINVVVG